MASRTSARRFALSFPKSRMASGAKIILKAISGYTIARTVTKSKPKLTRGPAIVDIFKLEDGNVVEHWDVIQPIPENAVNQNGMF